MTRLLLLTLAEDELLDHLRSVFADQATVVPIRDRDALLAAKIDDDTSLLAFGTGVVVPKALLDRFKRPAYNVHAATPDFPGRDPQHHAIWRRATHFGATLHVMDAKVDQGPIVAVERFEVNAADTPRDLLRKANQAAVHIIETHASRLLKPEPLPTLASETWGAVKTTRADLERLSRLSPLIGADEFQRRYVAFDGGEWDNLTTQLHGLVFRIDKRAEPVPQHDHRFADFTEASFRELLRLLKSSGYRFARFGESSAVKQVVWRHDVDVSMHRAARLAEIEAAEGIVASYFVNPHSAFYNMLEPEITALTRRIAAAGHEIGLHFDVDVTGMEVWSRDALEASLERERSLLETILGTPVRVFSWHNPGLSNVLEFDDSEICGLINVYSAKLRKEFVYCSDSNGYWRFQPMREVIAKGYPRLHLLTHPEWWTEEAMSPSQRMDRAILGRARAIRRDYDRILARGGRVNID